METLQTNSASQTESGPRDVFMHILAVVSLYTVIGSFIALVFGLINIYLPDPVLSWRHGTDAGAWVRFPLSVFVVAFPVYALIMRRLNKDVAETPSKGELKSRKWLFHLTITLAAALLAGNVTAILYQYLNGDLTIRFALQAFTLICVATATGIYYYDLIRGSASRIPAWMMKWFRIKVLVIALLAIGLGFYSAGSPASQRARNLDTQREQGLQELQWQIVNYWQAKEALPENLDVLRNSISGYVPPVDPETRLPYEYQITGENTFELCATFSLASIAGEQSYAIEPAESSDVGVTEHLEGRNCFQRVVDTDLYPPLKR